MRLKTVFTAPALALAWVPMVLAQPVNPLPDPIATEDGLIVVNFREFAAIPDSDDEAARMMVLVDEPGTERLFLNDMRGPVYTLSYDGSAVSQYVNINDPQWGVGVEYGGRERGFQSFALHPDFGREGESGYGRFYTWTDVTDTSPAPDFTPDGGNNTHDTVLLEWVAEDASADTYDGSAPRELMRFEQPFGNHNAGHIIFNPLVEPGDADYGLMYIGSADGGSGGDPLDLAQNLASAYGKILRIDPLGDNSQNGEYGIPADNPFADDGNEDILGEIYAYGVRNPQRLGWDPQNGNLFMSDIGQSMIEKVSLVTRGANLGWNDWEGSFRFTGQGQISTDNPRSDNSVTYPVVEYTRFDPIMQGRVAATGVRVYRDGDIEQMRDRVFFGDFVSGEILHFDADNLPEGGNQDIRRLLLRDGSGDSKTFLQVIQEKNEEQGRTPADRTDMRFGSGPNHEFFLLNKHDGTVRLLISD